MSEYTQQDLASQCTGETEPHYVAFRRRAQMGLKYWYQNCKQVLRMCRNILADESKQKVAQNVTQ